MKTWFTITNKADSPSAEIDIFDEIGLWGVSAKDFANALKAVPTDREIAVRINSPGGSVFDGFAIFDLLAARRNRVTTHVVGVAASMASIIALAGKQTVASENSTIMIHKPRGGAFGESEEMRKMADLLDKLEGRLVNVYAAKTGKPVDEISSALEETTWFTAEEAKAWGLVDIVSAPVKVAACFDLTRLGPVPDRITNLIQGGASASTKHQPNPYMEKLIAVLVEAKLIASADLNDEAAAASVQAALANQAAQAKALSDENSSLKSKVEAAQKQAEEAAFVAEVEGHISAKRIKEDAKAFWVSALKSNAVEARKAMASLSSPAPAAGVAPVKAEKGNESPDKLQGEALLAHYRSLKGKERDEFFAKNKDAIWAAYSNA